MCCFFLWFDPIHLPKFDYRIPDLTRPDFKMIEIYYRQLRIVCVCVCVRKQLC